MFNVRMEGYSAGEAGYPADPPGDYPESQQGLWLEGHAQGVADRKKRLEKTPIRDMSMSDYVYHMYGGGLDLPE